MSHKNVKPIVIIGSVKVGSWEARVGTQMVWMLK